jgi:cyclohexanone monooxygenase
MTATAPQRASDFDAVVVGAGFAGLYMLYKLRELGFSARVYEAGDGVGGTWYWNRYPGARCDVESIDYQYGFCEELLHEWEWSERYPRQPEILRYIEHVADRFDLRRDIQLETRVTAAVYDEDATAWTIETDRGDRVTATYCLMATGCLSTARIPSFEGLETFEGEWFHTGQWPHESPDFTGKRVGVIGTGSTGIQVIPQLARDAAHLFVFQRTPNYSVPAQNHALDAEQVRWMRETFAERRAKTWMSPNGAAVDPRTLSALEVTEEERQQHYERCWNAGGPALLRAYRDLLVDRDANETAAAFVRKKIAEIVDDRDVAAALTPVAYPFGTKRLCIDIDYFQTYNRDNVTLVDTRADPIEAITPTGLRTRTGEFELDRIVLATGFDAMTGALLAVDIRGRNGLTLREKWLGGPRTYLGLAVAGFPNLFTITGPGSPSVLSNVVASIEQHVEWIGDCLVYLRDRGLASLEATVEAEDAWVDHVREIADATLYPLADSWYVGANIPGKPRVFMPYVGGVVPYRKRCDAVAVAGYEGFSFTALADAAAARA